MATNPLPNLSALSTLSHVQLSRTIAHICAYGNDTGGELRLTTVDKLDLPLLRPLPLLLPLRGGLPLPRGLGLDLEPKSLPDPEPEPLDFPIFLWAMETYSHTVRCLHPKMQHLRGPNLAKFMCKWIQPCAEQHIWPRSNYCNRCRVCNDNITEYVAVLTISIEKCVAPFCT
ncbi:hypothetical protein M9H77_34926 [Catharanthus roseus]|uniref:Uncharacterized protein n=1 Tax=Catharanthus roseus TaxID=4058 RepID=A0ACB9ZMJ9_CATRO|nr:hypothetical protein M9H77_34926 [Catharanthus roseus]